MDKKNLPLFLMLAAGAVSCIITFIQGYSTLKKLVSLFIVLLVFYVLGNILKWTIEFFEVQNEKLRGEEGEVIEKSAEEQEEVLEETEEGEPAEPGMD